MVEQATQAASKFANNKDGFLQAISSFGGKPIVDKALKTLEAHPMVKIAVNGLLASNGTSIDNLKSELNGISAAPYAQKKSPVQSSSFRNRLNNLK